MFLPRMPDIIRVRVVGSTTSVIREAWKRSAVRVCYDNSTAVAVCMENQIKIIDLFSGPGGLGEGFSSYSPDGQTFPFKICFSVEKEVSAHATLTLRSFYRQFARGCVPGTYYAFLRGELGKDAAALYAAHPEEAKRAKEEANCLTLGEQNAEIYRGIRRVLKEGEPCIVIGGPPCQAYSLVGRARRSGEPEYVAEKDHRNFLYQEYLKILAMCKPLAFVMENVKGMLSAEVGGSSIFKQVARDLQDPCAFYGGGKKNGPKYRIFSLVVSPDGELSPADFVIRAEEYGIPQARHRVILLGVHEDLANKFGSSLILKKEKGPKLSAIIGGLPRLRSGLSKGDDSRAEWVATIAKIGAAVINQVKKTAIDGIQRDVLIGSIGQAISELPEVPDSRGGNFSNRPYSGTYKGMPSKLVDWYRDPLHEKLVCNHETRGHIPDDLGRYLFASAWADAADRMKWDRPFPRPHDYPEILWPKHKNFHSGVFADRFRVQVKGRYATTVTSHISKDGHYFIHYDPAQCRSLTVREAARIQTFPDNYFFMGNRTQQYVQVGNAVPPLLANAIAERVWKLIE